MLFCYHEKKYAKQNKNKDFVIITKSYYFYFEEKPPLLVMTTDKAKDLNWIVEDPIDENNAGTEKKNYYWKI